MVLVVDTEWDTLTIAVLVASTFFAWRVYGSFKGGPLGRPYLLGVLGSATLLVAFLVRLSLDFQGIRAVDAYGISVKDVAIIVAVVFFGAGAWDLGRFWRTSKDGFVGGKR